MNDDLIKWYLNSDGYNEEEIEKLNMVRVENGITSSNEEFKRLTQEFIDRMPYANISSDNRFITFGESGTYLIQKIFEKEVDDDTLVISTDYEHNAVQDCLNKCKNVYKFKNDKIRSYFTDELVRLSKNYKKVFVYIIGTQLSTGEITPQLFFDKLKDELVKNNIEHKILIDDVHGMFITPRNYDMFDYVLYTAHSLVTMYDMGMLISKTDDIGFKYYNWGVNYLERLDIVLKRKVKLMMFKNIMFQLLNKLFSDKKYFDYYNYTTNHIFSVQTRHIFYTKEEYDILDSYKIRIAERPMEVSWLRIRYQEFSKQTVERAIEGLNYLEKLMRVKMMVAEMRE